MNILDTIVEEKNREVEILRRDFTLSRFRDSEFFAKATMDIITPLLSRKAVALIAEVKKASPSKGVMIENFDHLAIAQVYMNNGADAVSVLTDKKFFQGSIDFLRDIAAEKTVPLLRKDFIIDEYQVYEAKANGADFILLISEILSKAQISELTAAAKEMDMEVLLELHSTAMFEKIDFEKNRIIGINNRNLETFEVDLNTTIEISKIVPPKTLLVAESGIMTRTDIHLLKSEDINGVLVGEHFSRSDNTAAAVSDFKKWCTYED